MGESVDRNRKKIETWGDFVNQANKNAQKSF